MIKIVKALVSAVVVAGLALVGTVVYINQSLPGRSLDDAAVKVLVSKDLSAGHGSGVVLKGGYILTAAHVVAGADTVMINGTVAQVLWYNESRDIALLRAPLGKHPTREIACRAPIVGEEIWASGFPGELGKAGEFGPITSRGVVSSKVIKSAFPNGALYEHFITDAVGARGLSGSAVVDRYGQVLGIYVAMFGDANQNLGLFQKNGYGAIIPSQSFCTMTMKA
jgi:S1-C subfamily serine protease